MSDKKTFDEGAELLELEKIKNVVIPGMLDEIKTHSRHMPAEERAELDSTVNSIVEGLLKLHQEYIDAVKQVEKSRRKASRQVSRIKSSRSPTVSMFSQMLDAQSALEELSERGVAIKAKLSQSIGELAGIWKKLNIDVDIGASEEQVGPSVDED